MGCCTACGAAGQEVQAGDAERRVWQGDVQAQPAGQNIAQEDAGWVRLGGTELEEPLSREWVKLVRADWLIERAEAGGTLARRQEMPPEAYVGLSELKQAGPAVLTGIGSVVIGEWLRVIVLSYPWLQPGHPDPHGENLRHIAQMLRHFVRDDTLGYVNGGKPYGVLIDFTALFQVPRTPQQHADFLHALPALNVFYSHPSTIVLKVTEFPEGYPHHPSFHYERPEGSNTVAYSERGWCFAESAMSGLVKSSDKVLDMGCYEAYDSLLAVIMYCKAGRTPPLHPDDFKGELDRKTFTSKGADFEKVARLYSAAFERRLGSAAALDYSNLGWGADAGRQLARALESTRLLQKLALSENRIEGEGAVAILEALQHHTSLELELNDNNIGQQNGAALGAALQRNSALRTLKLGRNALGHEGAAALGGALESNRALQHLDLPQNNIGDEGAVALGQALERNGMLRSLDLANNRIGGRGAAALGQALERNSSLQTLALAGNEIGGGGAMALAKALQCNRSLRSLNLSDGHLGGQGAAALGQALERNSSLQTLEMTNNRVDEDCATALAKALQGNSALQTLNLCKNIIRDSGAIALAQALQANTSLHTLDLRDNEIHNDGAMALAQALQGNCALQSLNLGWNLHIGTEAKEALRQAARARPDPLELLV